MYEGPRSRVTKMRQFPVIDHGLYDWYEYHTSRTNYSIRFFFFSLRLSLVACWDGGVTAFLRAGAWACPLPTGRMGGVQQAQI